MNGGLSGVAHLSYHVAFAALLTGASDLYPWVFLPLLMMYCAKLDDWKQLVLLWATLAASYSGCHWQSQFEGSGGIILVIGGLFGLVSITPILALRLPLLSRGDPRRNGVSLFPILWTLSWMVCRTIIPFPAWNINTLTALSQLGSIGGLGVMDLVFAICAEQCVKVAEGRFVTRRDTTTMLATRAIHITRKHVMVSAILLGTLGLLSHRSTGTLFETHDPAHAVHIGCVTSLHMGSRNSKHPRKDLAAYIRQTHHLASSTADIIMWHEAALNFPNETAWGDMIQLVGKTANNTGHVLVTGIVETKAGTKNRAALLSSSGGQVLFSYDKQRLVPIAESFSMTPGTDPIPVVQVPLRGNRGNLTLSAAICHDFDYPHTMRPASSSALVLQPSKTWNPYSGLLHFRNARMRAIEGGFGVARCDPEVSGVTDEVGRVSNLRVRSEAFLSEVLLHDTTKGRWTLYGLVGDWSVWALLVGWTAWVLGTMPDFRGLAGRVGGKARVLMNRVRRGGHAPGFVPGEDSPLLIDA